MRFSRFVIFGYVFLAATQYAFAATVEVAITPGGGFSPASVNISTGDTVRWTNNDSVTRNVSSDPHPAHTDYAPLNLGNVAASGQLTLTFSSAGTYNYHDHLYSGFGGSVVVSTPPPSPSPSPPPPAASVPTSPVFEQMTIAEITATSATILWTTQRRSYTRLAYGTSSGALPKKTLVEEMLTYTHSALLSALLSQTTYYVKALGGAALNEEFSSEELKFTTPSLPASIIPAPTTMVEEKIQTIVPVVVQQSATTETSAAVKAQKDVKLFSDKDVLKPNAKGDAVQRLQEFLARDKKVYPEGIVSGFYGKLTQKAVERLQIKYGIVKSGSPATTGFGLVGPKTKATINRLLNAEE